MNKILTKSIGPDEMVQGIGVALLPISTPMRREADSKLERISWGKGDSFFHERTCSEICLPAGSLQCNRAKNQVRTPLLISSYPEPHRDLQCLPLNDSLSDNLGIVEKPSLAIWGSFTQPPQFPSQL